MSAPIRRHVISGSLFLWFQQLLMVIFKFCHSPFIFHRVHLYREISHINCLITLRYRVYATLQSVHGVTKSQSSLATKQWQQVVYRKVYEKGSKCLTYSLLTVFKLMSGILQFSSVAHSCLTLCNPMNRSTPGLLVYYQLPEFTQTHVHWVGDAIQSSQPLLSPSPPAANPSQHLGLFQWVNSSHEVAKVLDFQLQHQSFQWTPRTDLL